MTPNQDVNAVLRSQEYFRLKQVVQSPGDIYELNESAKAVYIGPDSDIAEVQLTYFNPNEPLGLETAVVAVNGPFVGRVDSLPQTQVPTTSQPARILVSPVDIVDNAYVPPGSMAFRRFNIPTVIDLIVSLKTLPSIPSVRADRTLRFPGVPYDRHVTPPPGTDGSTELLIPIYGRRLVTVTLLGMDVRAQFSLVTLQPGANTEPRLLGDIHIGTSLPPTIGTRAAVIRASDAARYGQIFDNAIPIPTQTGNYVESDEPPSIPTTFVPVPRGMADLLLIQITDNDSLAPPATRFVDVYVKIADRET